MKFPVLTYTFLSNFENCPHKAYRLYVKKDLPYQQPSPEMAKGIRAHEALEARITKGVALDSDLRSADAYCQAFDMMEGVNVRAEYKLAMKIDGGSCQWDAQDAWLRGKADVVVWAKAGGWLVDWKTGKVREQPFELEVQGLLMQANHPDTTLWQGEYFWMQENRPGNRYTLSPAETFQKVGRMYADAKAYFEVDDWPKQPNPLCGWCGVLDCEHNKKFSSRAS